MPFKKTTVRNSKGEAIQLNSMERKIANAITRQANALGYEVDTTTLTQIMARITEQKFFQIAPADYLPVRVGEGAWAQELLTYRSFETGGDFEKGIINTGSDNSRMAAADAGVDPVSVKVANWAKKIGWSLFDLQIASRSGNWDIVVAKEKSRKKNWDLGIQRVAFLGTQDAAVKGLLTQSGITTNTSLIGKPISTMSATELSTFVSQILGVYRANSAHTSYPSHFVIPEDDYLGLAAPADPNFPIKSKKEVLRETFAETTGNADFKILPLAYAMAANSGDALSKNRYALYNYEEESLRMDIPVDYNNTLANSLDGFHFQNVGYGQFTGAQAYRPKEMIYFEIA